MESQLTTGDVYETASLIGKDMEKIIENFGHDVVIDIMPKIIQVLEQLEVVVDEREKSSLEMEEMRLQNARLLTEVKREAGQRRRLDEELFQYKQASTREIAELNKIIEKLKDENQALHAEEEAHELEKMEKKEKVQHLSSADLAVLEQMKDTIDSQRDVIRSKDIEIQSTREDLEAMEEQVERLANINETIRRNLTLQKSRNSTLAQEKADLEAEIKALSQHFSAGKRIIEINVTENSEIESKKLSETEDKTDKEEDGEPRKKDPNRPRFTLKELQRVLKERNELKEKVIALGEDLDFYKKRCQDEVDSASLEMHTSPKKGEEKHNHETHKSGISKLFKFLWKEEHKTPLKPEGCIVVDRDSA